MTKKHTDLLFGDQTREHKVLPCIGSGSLHPLCSSLLIRLQCRVCLGFRFLLQQKCSVYHYYRYWYSVNNLHIVHSHQCLPWTDFTKDKNTPLAWVSSWPVWQKQREGLRFPPPDVSRTRGGEGRHGQWPDCREPPWYGKGVIFLIKTDRGALY